MENQRFTRQRDIVSEEALATPICVIGAGGIGSLLTLNLAKFGFQNIEVYDFDKIEEHNLPNQYFPTNAVGHYKVDALAEFVELMTDTKITIHPVKFDFNPRHHRIVILAVDSLEVRKEIWDEYQDDDWDLWVDGRMGAEDLAIYFVSKHDHEATLEYSAGFSPEKLANVSNDPCTAKSTIYTPSILSGFMIAQIKNYLMHHEYKTKIFINASNLGVQSFPEQTAETIDI